MITGFEYEGYEYGVDNRTMPNYKRKVMLRETKTMWISKCGRRYSKKNGGRVLGSWPMYYLDLNTVTKVDN